MTDTAKTDNGKGQVRMTAENLETLLASIDLSKPAPEEEPLRQYYFLKKCRIHVQKEAERLGRPLTACVTTFGCRTV